ncbi:hypothetical protein E4U19_005071 [Claviceps sp. Clav32 group G5]|nr:hypothetical protein E4U19_005071 [Claviceps sp. Clav32 group G5]
MAMFPEDVRYSERYKLNRTVAQTPENHGRWPEGSGESGANPAIHSLLLEVGTCRAKSRKRSSCTSSAGSHDAQLKRLRNAQASKRSRTRSKTMQQRLDESVKGRKLAEEESRQDRELRLKAEEGIRQRDKEIERLKKPK